MKKVSDIPISLPPDKPAAEPAAGKPTNPSQKAGKQVDRQDVVEKHIRAFGFEPTRTLLLKIQEKADYWHRNDFQVGATLERIQRRIAGKPEQAPHQWRWFLAALENEWKEESGR
jgi:hypothetical protein